MISTTRHIAVFLSAACALALTGCSLTSTGTPTGSAPIAGAALQGRVFGGQQPVVGGTIQLYAVGTTGYGSAARALIGSPVMSTAGGAFNITNTYTCQPGDQVYLVATGGNPGVSGTQSNSALALMTGLGLCSGLNTANFVNVNELTTVASVWALAPFMKDLTHVGTSATNIAGITNAFAAVNKVVNVSTGTVGGPALPVGATLPAIEINTLADVLALCVNSVDTIGPAAQSAICTAVFAAATPGTTAPTNTVQAALNLAQNPTLGLAALNGMVTGLAPFQPTLGTAPTSWTIAINYVGGGLSAPKGIAVDASGGVWTPNSSNNTVTKLDNTGAALSGASGFMVGSLNAPAGIAIDTGGNAWIANSGNNTISQISSSGSTGTSYTGAGVSSPVAIAIDAAGNVWTANSGNGSLSEFTSAGAAVSTGTGFTAGGNIPSPVALAIDPK